MSTCQLAENAFLSEAQGGLLGDLFQSPAFFRLHDDGNGRFFEWTDGEKVIASVHFATSGDGTWRSPARGTYAGYAFGDSVSIMDLIGFHGAVEARLRKLGASRLELLPAPMLHDTRAFALQMYALSSGGFSVCRSDLNQSQTVRPEGLPISRGNRRCAEKARQAGYVCEQLPSSALPHVYATIAANRSAKGYPISMRLDQLEQMQRQLPKAMVLFGCRHRDDETLAAAALCLRLSASKLYVFYWGDRPEYTRLSPVVVLADAIHAYCVAHRIALLDVGTSTEGSVPNTGLLRFKDGLGFETGLKVRLEKVL